MKKPLEITRPHGLTVRDVRALLATANPDAVVWLACPDGLYKARHLALDAFNPGPEPVAVFQAVRSAP